MIGILSALGAASSWTYACHLWRKQAKYFSAIQINLIKNIIAIGIFSPIILTFELKSNFYDVFTLLVSGVIGIAIGDSFYIVSLRKLGTRRTLTVEALSPLIATILGSFLLNENPPFKVWIGIFIVSISLVRVAYAKTSLKEFEPSMVIQKDGFIFAFISVLCAVIAAVLSRSVLINSDFNPFQTTEIRLIGGLIALLPFARFDWIKNIKTLPLKDKSKLFYASFLGTNLGILLQQNVFLLLPIGLGWTLLSTSPAFSLFYATAEGEKLDLESFLLTGTTILGVAIAFI